MTQQTIVTSALELNLGNLLGVPASVALTNALKSCDDNFIQLFADVTPLVLIVEITETSGASAGQILYSNGTVLEASVTLPSGTLAATNTFAGDKTTQVATDAFVQAAC